MENLGDIGNYVWHRLPLILLFTSGYLVYQMMAVTRITDGFVSWAIRKSGGRATYLLLYVIGAAAVLSSFIPNTITVLTLLPVLKSLDENFKKQGVDGMTTVLMVSAIYGAAIGGFGSMIGTPGNAILLGALDFFQVQGREQINFFNWFLWSVPMVGMFTLAAWGVAAGIGLPGEARSIRVDMGCLEDACETNDRQRFGGRLFWVYMGFWVLEAVAQQVLPGAKLLLPVASLIFFVCFLYLTFGYVAPESPFAHGSLLRISDLGKGIPRRGLLFVLGLMVLIAVVRWLGLDEMAAVAFKSVLKSDISPTILLFLLILAVIFLTEVFSNTAVVAAFFTIAYYAAQNQGVSPILPMVGVGVASTCAFMTPIATPTSALAFGEMRGASLLKMIGLGFVLNVAGAIIMTGWLGWVLPIVYGNQ